MKKQVPNGTILYGCGTESADNRNTVAMDSQGRYDEEEERKKKSEAVGLNLAAYASSSTNHGNCRCYTTLGLPTFIVVNTQLLFPIYLSPLTRSINLRTGALPSTRGDS